jgi:hypothetical protein
VNKYKTDPKHPWKDGGSVSTATLRVEDLLKAFFGAVQAIDPERAEDVLKNPRNVAFRHWFEGRKPDYPDSEDACYFVDEVLCDLLGEMAPEGHYFGTHPGDGADFGFWPEPEDDE